MDSGFDRVQRVGWQQEREKNLYNTNRNNDGFADSMQVEKARESIAALRAGIMQNSDKGFSNRLDKNVKYDFGDLTNFRDKGL